MSGTDWKDLEAAWQSLPDDSVPALARKELRRAARLRWWSKTYFVIEILSTVFAWCAGALLVAYGDGVKPIFGIGFIFRGVDLEASIVCRHYHMGAEISSEVVDDRHSES